MQGGERAEGSLKPNPMERRRLADISATNAAHVYINRPMATSRRRFIPFQAAFAPTQSTSQSSSPNTPKAA